MMAIYDEKAVVENLRILTKENDGLKNFFYEMSSRKRASAHTKETPVTKFEEITGGDRQKAIRLMDQLEEAGAGRRKNGRKGFETRFDWGVSDLISLAKDVCLDEPVTRVLTLEEVKEIVGRSLGVDPSSIEIRI